MVILILGDFYMKIFKRIILILILLIILIYVTNITSIPDNIILFKGENLNLNTVFGVNIVEKDYKAIQTSSNLNNNEILETKTVSVSLFNIINLKEIEVNTIPNTTVIPLGNSVGLKLYTSGVLVVGMTEIEGQKPYENTGIEEGDLIVEIDNKQISTTEELVECVNSSNGQTLEITYVRDGNEYNTNIEPIETSNNEYKLGLWVRDGAAGVGTITYYEPSTKSFAALGHGIVDSDTSKLISIASGELVTTSISSIVKGKENEPGEIRGTIKNQEAIGEISSNTEFGIYGKLNNISLLNSNQTEYEVATRDEIKVGEAKIILTLEDGIRKEYDMEVEKIYRNNNSDNKSMLIKVVDEELLNLTGGIIQGMSGAPIVQNGKFIGAVTHVLVSDPTTGYAIFGDLMIKEMREVK